MATSSDGIDRAWPPSNLRGASLSGCSWLGRRVTIELWQLPGKRRGRMAIIDAQVHLWRKGTASPPHLTTPYLVEDAIRGMDEAGVDGAILHPPASWDPDSNEQAVEAVLAYPKRFAILGNPPLDKPESRALIATWKKRPGMLGFRFYF